MSITSREQEHLNELNDLAFCADFAYSTEVLLRPSYRAAVLARLDVLESADNEIKQSFISPSGEKIAKRKGR